MDEKTMKNSNFLDEIIKSLKPTDILNIIGKVGTGKSSLAINIIKNIVINSNKNVAIFSLETASVSLIPLLIKMKINKLNVFINKSDFEKNPEIEEITSKGFFYLYDGENIKTGKIKTQIDSLIEELKKRKQKLDLIVIDYLQLTYPSTDNLYIDTEDKKGKKLREDYDALIKQFAETNLNEIMEMNIKKLKEIAENYNIPIILVTMLNNNEKKGNEQRKVIKENSDIVIEIERQEKDTIMKLTLPNKQTQNINVQFNKTLCEFVETKTRKQLKEDAFRKEIEQIIKEHKDEFDKLS